MKKVLMGLVALVVLSTLALVASAYMEDRRTLEEIRSLGDVVRAARISADSCRNELDYEEQLFRRFDGRVDSLRGEVRAFEELDVRGVPEERYEEYLVLFESYNDSAQAWEDRAQALRESEETCRNLVITHNALSDSLSGRVERDLPRR